MEQLGYELNMEEAKKVVEDAKIQINSNRASS
jgi:hypothetical protein